MSRSRGRTGGKSGAESIAQMSRCASALPAFMPPPGGRYACRPAPHRSASDLQNPGIVHDVAVYDCEH